MHPHSSLITCISLASSSPLAGFLVQILLTYALLEAKALEAKAPEAKALEVKALEAKAPEMPLMPTVKVQVRSFSFFILTCVCLQTTDSDKVC